MFPPVASVGTHDAVDCVLVNRVARRRREGASTSSTTAANLELPQNEVLPAVDAEPAPASVEGGSNTREFIPSAGLPSSPVVSGNISAALIPFTANPTTRGMRDPQAQTSSTALPVHTASSSAGSDPALTMDGRVLRETVRVWVSEITDHDHKLMRAENDKLKREVAGLKNEVDSLRTLVDTLASNTGSASSSTRTRRKSGARASANASAQHTSIPSERSQAAARSSPDPLAA